MKDQIMNDINKNEFTEKKPIIDLLALWEEVEDIVLLKYVEDGISPTEMRWSDEARIEF
jgi:hypothetical protein